MGIDLLRSSSKRWTLWDCGRARPPRQRSSSHLTNEVKNTPAPRCGKVNRGLLPPVRIKTGRSCEMRRASPRSLIKVRLMTGVESRRWEIHGEQKTYPFSSFFNATPDSTYEWAGEVHADQSVDVTCAVWLRRPQERPPVPRRCTNSARNSVSHAGKCCDLRGASHNALRKRALVLRLVFGFGIWLLIRLLCSLLLSSALHVDRWFIKMIWWCRNFHPRKGSSGAKGSLVNTKCVRSPCIYLFPYL